jgi:hypothetical protein
MTTEGKLAPIHHAIGEFVVIFQGVEDLYRQIGWFILDPDRESWPPIQLRKETSGRLIDKVTDMFVELTRTYAFSNGAETADDILRLRDRFHELRRYRNRLLHSTYAELKAGDDVHGYIRSNPEIGVDPETGELIFDREHFTAEAIHKTIRNYGDDVHRLSCLQIQLLHWAPFARHKKLDGP